MKAQLKRIILNKQGLLSGATFGKGEAGTLNAIEHLGYVQVDTISVIERAHHHVLYTRVPGYTPHHLNALVGKQKIFEYWSHAASYLPMRDYRYALVQMNAVRRGENRYYNNVEKRLLKEVLARFVAEGPLRARDFETGSKTKGGWWNWGPAKRAIERLYMQGDLMICERQGMEKIYDISARCLPSDIDLSEPSTAQHARHLFMNMLRSHGVFTFKQLVHLKTGKDFRNCMQEIVDEHLQNDAITALNPQGEAIKKGEKATFYAQSTALEQSTRASKAVKILSPFDNALIHRDRLRALFNFDYTIECYVPAAKRQFGYFSLPVLYGKDFVARIDCKAHRAEKRFELISMHLEDGFDANTAFKHAFNAELNRFAAFNQCGLCEGPIS